ncbi:Carbon starvation induced regulator [Yokenella regensburgei]|nr:Carbon starvation induced regulator [Yokenella regensburgei]
MTVMPQPTAIDGYRWLKNDIIRGVYQPDEKLRMSGLTERYALGVGRCGKRFRSWWPSGW